MTVVVIKKESRQHRGRNRGRDWRELRHKLNAKCTHVGPNRYSMTLVAESGNVKEASESELKQREQGELKFSETDNNLPRNSFHVSVYSHLARLTKLIVHTKP